MKFNLLALSLLLVAGAAYSVPAQAASPGLQGIICDPQNVSTEDGAFVRFVNSQAFGHLNLTFGAANSSGGCCYDGILVGAKINPNNAIANFWQLTASGSECSSPAAFTFVTTPSGVTLACDNFEFIGPIGTANAFVGRWTAANNYVPSGSRFAAMYFVDGGECCGEPFSDIVQGATVNGVSVKPQTSQVPIYDCTAFDYYYCCY